MTARLEFATAAVTETTRPGMAFDAGPGVLRELVLRDAGPIAVAPTPAPAAAEMIRQILLQVTPDHHPGQQIAVGIDIAARFGARLVGLYAMPRPMRLRSLLRPDSPVVAAAEQVERDKALALVERLRRIAARSGIELDWHAAAGSAASLVAGAAPFHDLAVVAQGDPQGGGMGSDVVRRVVLRGGRPVVVVPPRAASPVIGHHVLALWNESRESALAIRAALPFMATAERVTILATPELLAGDVEATPGLGARDFLRRHGVDAALVPFAMEGANPAGTLLEFAEASGADLVVAGAFGTWPIHAWRLGGFTRALLETTRIPLLLCR